jgi:asparagine synthase (glutamine-hydrolysing)
MCGIFGSVGCAATQQTNERALAALQHRGPDLQGAWLAGDVALAHARLKVIDLSDEAAQPMAGCDGRAVRVTFNGEIYNHHELRAELLARGHRFRSRSDTEAIVHGYEEWGEAVVDRLDGMFAFGLWDGRARRLLLARDRTGKKPLFYALAPDGCALRFASEPKALYAAGLPRGCAGGLDEAQLPTLLALGFVPAPATIHRGVRQLAPATYLIHEPDIGRQRLVEYWRPTFLEPPARVSAKEARARVRELVVAAVQRRLESDVPLGAFLSGGLDSTIVVGVMARLLGRRVKTFSIGFAGDAAYDETAFAREAALAFDTEHTEFIVEPAQLASPALLETLVWHHDGPFADSSAVPTYTVSKLTKQHVTVALSGDGGDELFAGYLRFLAAEAAERLPRFVRRNIGSAAALLPRAPGERTLAGRARRFLASAALPLPERIAAWGGLFAGEIPSLLQPELVAALPLDGPGAYLRALFAAPPGATPLARLLEHNFRAYLAWDLHPKVDRCSAGVGLEVRSPLLDTALVEYVGRLPDARKRRPAWHPRGPQTKRVLREAFADLIPEPIQRRGKMGFGMPLATWFRGPLRPLLGDLLGPTARLHGLLQRSATDGLLQRHMSGEDLSARLFLLLTLEIWLRSLSAAAQPEAGARSVGAAS